jgi:hypothetical protein
MAKFAVLSHQSDPGNSGSLTRIVEVEWDKHCFTLTLETVGGAKTSARLSRKAIEEMITGIDLILDD